MFATLIKKHTHSSQQLMEVGSVNPLLKQIIKT